MKPSHIISYVESSNSKSANSSTQSSATPLKVLPHWRRLATCVRKLVVVMIHKGCFRPPRDPSDNLPPAQVKTTLFYPRGVDTQIIWRRIITVAYVQISIWKLVPYEMTWERRFWRFFVFNSHGDSNLQAGTNEILVQRTFLRGSL